MSFIDTKRIIKSGWINFKRNGIVSVAAVLVVTITLCVLTGLVFVQAILHSSLTEIENKVDVTMYFSTSATEDKILSVQSSIEALPEVALVTYTSREDAIATFRERHKDDYLTLQALDELDENPLGASLAIKAHDSAQYDSIVKFIEGDTGPARTNANIIDKINYNQNKLVIDRLNNIISGARTLGFAITVVLMIIAVIITFNTIRLTIFIAKEEIGVMRLVGAANKYIRGPFMVEGIIYGLFSSVITLGLFFPITLWFGKSMTNFLGMNLYSYYTGNFLQIFVIVIVSGVVLGAVSSFLAVHKYLRK